MMLYIVCDRTNMILIAISLRRRQAAQGNLQHVPSEGTNMIDLTPFNKLFFSSTTSRGRTSGSSTFPLPMTMRVALHSGR